MKKPVRALYLGLALQLAGLGCSAGLIRGGNHPPDWVDRLPKRPHTMCAVGYSGPTFYQPDCLKNASDNARGHLADNISSRIRTITIDISDGTRGHFSRDVYVQGSESASDAVINGAQIESRWLDTQGLRGQSKGCYSLVCVDLNKPIDSYVEKLAEQKNLPKKTVERTRQNAKAAFEELERAEKAR